MLPQCIEKVNTLPESIRHVLESTLTLRVFTESIQNCIEITTFWCTAKEFAKVHTSAETRKFKIWRLQTIMGDTSLSSRKMWEPESQTREMKDNWRLWEVGLCTLQNIMNEKVDFATDGQNCYWDQKINCRLPPGEVTRRKVRKLQR